MNHELTPTQIRDLAEEIVTILGGPIHLDNLGNETNIGITDNAGKDISIPANQFLGLMRALQALPYLTNTGPTR